MTAIPAGDTLKPACQPGVIDVLKLLEDLLQLQEFDLKIQRLRKELGDAPVRQDQLRKSAHSQEESLKRAEDDLHKIQSEIKQLEIEAESLRERILRYRNQQNDVKSNDEYRALTDEISACESKISGVEDRQLEQMSKAEVAQEAVGRARAALEDARRQVETGCSALEDRSTRVKSELGELETRRSEYATGLDVVWIGRYEKIFSHRGDAAVVPIEGGVCGGCHMILPPQISHDAKVAENTGRISTCSFCGRLLYYKG